MFGPSMILTIGQALERAEAEELTVQVHVAGVWVSGRVLNADGQTVVLTNGRDEISVLRLDIVSCVRIPFEAAAHEAPTQQASQQQPAGSGAPRQPPRQTRGLESAHQSTAPLP